MVGFDFDDFCGLFVKVFDEWVVVWIVEVEVQECFLCQLIEYLGVCGVFDVKWVIDVCFDVGKFVEFVFVLGQLVFVGIGVGVSLYDLVIVILCWFGKLDYLWDICDQVICGVVVLCIGVLEEFGGFDLQIVEIEIWFCDGGFEVCGVKKFVLLFLIVDYIMVVVCSVDYDLISRYGNVVVVVVLVV